jgi:hypothetical protein
MRKRAFWLESVLPPVALFAVCLAVRVILECGFVMGDDMAVVAISDVQSGGIRWIREQVNLRFGVWAPYLLSFKLFGTGELGFFTPSWFVSSSFASGAYLLMRRWKYSLAAAIFAGLFVGLAPFEVLIGTTLANDVFLAAVFAYGLLVWQYRDAVPKLAGVLLGVLLWFGFFNKAWVIYLFPFLGVEFLRDSFRGRRFGFWGCLIVVTIVLHAAAAWSYMRTLGDPFPLLKLLPAHYPVPRAQLAQLLLTYPYHIFVGDWDSRTTLFGIVPYVWWSRSSPRPYPRAARGLPPRPAERRAPRHVGRNLPPHQLRAELLLSHRVPLGAAHLPLSHADLVLPLAVDREAPYRLHGTTA